MLSRRSLFQRRMPVAVLIGLCMPWTPCGVAEETAQKTSYAAPLPTAHDALPTSHDTLPTVQQTANEVLEKKADLLMAHKEYVSAIRVYESVVLPDAQVLNKTGIAYEKMRMFEKAKVSFDEAMTLNPRLPGPSNNMGTVYYAEGDLRRSEKYYKKALKLDPRNASIYNNLGTLYFTKRKMHKGVEAYQQALSLDPEIFQRSAQNGIQANGTKESVALINYYLAETCAQAGKTTAAMAYLRRAVGAGFHDQAKLRDDRNFASLREMPEFQSLFVAEAKP